MLNLRALLFACSTDSRLRGACDRALVADAFAACPRPPSCAALVKARDALYAAVPPRMVAAIRRLRGTRDYAGAVRAAWRYYKGAEAAKASALLPTVAPLYRAKASRFYRP